MMHDFCKLDFSSPDALSSQLANNISRAIASGDLQPGDRLPSIVKMAERCGTSVRVPREAVRLLENVGILKGRPRSGVVVLDKRRFVWRGSVLFVSYGRQSYYYRGVLFKNIALRLSSAGWRVDFINLACGEGGTRKQMEPLRRALQNGHRLVFGAHLDKMVISEIRKSGVPYISITGSVGVGDEDAVGRISLSESRAIVELAEACARIRVGHVLRVALDDSYELFDTPFRMRGIATENLVLRPDTSINRFENSSRLGFRHLMARLSDRRSPKVDLVYFADDSFTAAGLWALERLGLRMPRDIRVVTLSNRGNRPFFPQPLTCVEHDLVADAERIAQVMIAFLDGRKYPRQLTCAAHYVPGETF